MRSLDWLYYELVSFLFQERRQIYTSCSNSFCFSKIESHVAQASSELIM